MALDRRWVQRLISEERPAAAVLLAAAALGLALATSLSPASLHALLHPAIGDLSLDLAWFAADGLLVVFFFVAGLELRHEFINGSLTSVRAAAVPVAAAILGMAVPALLFIALVGAEARAAWGVPMATDLPLALALVAIAGRGLPIAFRAFLLSLAIVDDALSILVIAIAFGGSISLAWCCLAAALVLAYSRLQPRSNPAAFVIAACAWLAMLRTGVHPTVLGIALGLATRARPDELRDRWQPVAGFIAVPLFVATSLAIPVTAAALDGRMAMAVTVARVVGKPVGILLGALIALRLLRPPSPLPARAYLVAGSVAGLGFSVSMLFAELGLPAESQPATKMAILVAMLASGLVGALALTWLRRKTPTE